ncbi:hypothetical protein SGB_05329 [Shigella boydii ATCC 9905]|nr:hypothetical protein SGB_05329 [Shigella boydii ATCC 9905]
MLCKQTVTIAQMIKGHSLASRMSGVNPPLRVTKYGKEK